MKEPSSRSCRAVIAVEHKSFYNYNNAMNQHVWPDDGYESSVIFLHRVTQATFNPGNPKGYIFPSHLKSGNLVTKKQTDNVIVSGLLTIISRNVGLVPIMTGITSKPHAVWSYVLRF